MAQSRTPSRWAVPPVGLFHWTRVEHWTAFRLDARGTLDSVEPAHGILKWQENGAVSRTKKAKFWQKIRLKKANFSYFFFSEKPKFFPGKTEIFKKKNWIPWILFEFFFLNFCGQTLAFEKNWNFSKKNKSIKKGHNFLLLLKNSTLNCKPNCQSIAKRAQMSRNGEQTRCLAQTSKMRGSFKFWGP